MLRAASVIASIGLVMIAISGTIWAQEAPKPDAPPSFVDMLDARRLPRMAGAQEARARQTNFDPEIVEMKDVPRPVRPTLFR
jgi:hypothetical protein